jgi:predicted dehydrogenase
MTHPCPLRIGILGTDTSHVTAFAGALNTHTPANHPVLAGARITDALPSFSPDIPSSASRHERFAHELASIHGVRLHETLSSMAEKVDAFIIHSIDGRKHRQQLDSLLPYGKPVFVDKPFAASLEDAVAMFDAADAARVPVFSSSLYRFRPSLLQLLASDVGRRLHVLSIGPCHVEPSHPDWLWYGIHPVEALFTVLGPRCLSVTRTKGEHADVLTGLWADGTIGTVLGLRAGPMPAGVTIHGENGIVSQRADASTAFGATDDYIPLIEAVVSFFRSGTPPVLREETLALFQFLHAAQSDSPSCGPVQLTPDASRACCSPSTF